MMDVSPTDLADRVPFDDFDSAASALLTWLQERLGFALWAVTELEDGHHRLRVVVDERYGVARGTSYRWLDTRCQMVLDGTMPPVAWDTREVPACAALPPVPEAPTLAFVGVPLCQSDGGTVGMLCAADPLPQLADLRDEVPMLGMMGRLLSTLHAWARREDPSGGGPAR